VRRSCLAAGCVVVALLAGPACGDDGGGGDDGRTSSASTTVTADDPGSAPEPAAGPTTELDEEAVRTHVAARVRELGGDVDPSTIVVSAMPGGDVAPGVVAFVAAYDGSAGPSHMAGIVDADGPNTRPLDAVGRVFDAWLADGGLPDPTRAAEVVSFIQGGGERQALLRTDADVARLPKPEWREVAGPPQLIDVKGAPGVEFWIQARMGLTRRRVSARNGGGAVVEDRPVADVLKGR
jgi:hypothetical protein